MGTSKGTWLVLRHGEGVRPKRGDDGKCECIGILGEGTLSRVGFVALLLLLQLYGTVQGLAWMHAPLNVDPAPLHTFKGGEIQ